MHHNSSTPLPVIIKPVPPIKYIIRCKSIKFCNYIDQFRNGRDDIYSHGKLRLIRCDYAIIVTVFGYLTLSKEQAPSIPKNQEELIATRLCVILVIFTKLFAQTLPHFFQPRDNLKLILLHYMCVALYDLLWNMNTNALMWSLGWPGAYLRPGHLQTLWQLLLQVSST